MGWDGVGGWSRPSLGFSFSGVGGGWVVVQAKFRVQLNNIADIEFVWCGGGWVMSFSCLTQPLLCYVENKLWLGF